MRPQLKIWNRMLRIGGPAGLEFILLFVYILIVYAIIRGFGPAAQAGFGVGARVMQALFLPVVALSFAASPVVGQKLWRTSGETSRPARCLLAIRIAIAMMFVLALLAYFLPAPMIRAFSKRSERDQFRRRIFAHRRAQLHRRRHRLHHLQHLSGPR